MSRMFVTPALEVVQGCPSVIQRGHADQHDADDELFDAHSKAALLVEKLQADNMPSLMLPPQELAVRALAHASLWEDELSGIFTGWGTAAGGPMPLYSPPRHQQLLSWISDAEGAPILGLGVTSPFNQRCSSRVSYELLPLPPALNQCASSDCERPIMNSTLPCASQLTSIWEPDAFPQGPCWLPSWAEARASMPVFELGWAYGSEVVFGPGASVISDDPLRVSYDALPVGDWGFPGPCQQSVEEQRARRALAEANLSGPGLVSVITEKVAGLHIDEQHQFIGKIAAIISSSILGGPPAVSSPSPRKLKQRLLRAVKASRQSSRLQQLRSSLSSSRRSQAFICVRLGFIKSPEDFCDDTLLAYL